MTQRKLRATRNLHAGSALRLRQEEASEGRAASLSLAHARMTPKRVERVQPPGWAALGLCIGTRAGCSSEWSPEKRVRVGETLVMGFDGATWGMVVGEGSVVLREP